MPLLPGEMIAGYTIESVIARGGMGVVYRAHQAELGRSVALKVIAAEHAGDAVARARFVREARLAASLDHPHVIPIFEAGDEDGVLFIAMRLVEGADLDRRISSSGPLDPRLAVDLIEQAAAGLDAAHARGLVHRDVKPANILLGGAPDAPHVYVSDFGAAKSTTSGRALTSSSGWIGTAGYAAPEQMQGREVDARADVYALGGVLLAALSGRSPGEEAPPTAAPEGPAARLDLVVARALARRPAERYPSAGALAAAARSALDGRPRTRRRTAATLPAPTRRDRRPPGRGRPDWVVPALVGLVAVALAIAAAVLAGSDHPHRTAAPLVVAPGAGAGAASGDGDTVVCQRTTCVQGARAVAAPIEGGACRRGGRASTWTRIDRHAPEPMLICLPATNPPAGGAPPPVPALIGAQLDRAELALDRLGLGHDTSGGGLFGILDRSNWTVCATTPSAGTRLAGSVKVKLFVDHSC